MAKERYECGECGYAVTADSAAGASGVGVSLLTCRCGGEMEYVRLAYCTACGHRLHPENYSDGDYIVCPMCRSGYYK